MYIHKNILEYICDFNVKYYMEYIDFLKKEILNTMKEISQFLVNKDVTVLRFNVHKLISSILYLENGSELLHLCKFVLHQRKRINLDPNELDIYTYYVNEILKISVSSLF